MAKLTLVDVANLQNETTALATMAANNDLIENALEITLSRDGTTPNTMVASLDMNSNRILNLLDPVSNQEPITLAFGTANYGDSLTNANNAEASEDIAEAAAVTAAAQAVIATTQAATATAQATTATTQASTATSQASTATTQAGIATVQAAAAAASAATLAAGWAATSTSSLLIATGAKSFTTQAGKLYTAGNFLQISSAANNANYMHGTVTSYSGTSLVMNITDVGGSGTLADWNINLSGTQGPAGSGTISGMTNHGVMIASGAAAGTSLGVATDGQLIVGQSAADPQLKTLSGDATLAASGALTLANGAGTRTNLGLAIGTNVQAWDTQLDEVASQTLTSGYSATSFSAGTKSSGTFTPAPASGNFQHYTNGGAHILAPPATVCSMVIECTNASAGAITTSGFSIVSGDTYSSTGTKKHIFFVTKTNSFSSLNVLYVTGT